MRVLALSCEIGSANDAIRGSAVQVSQRRRGKAMPSEVHKAMLALKPDAGLRRHGVLAKIISIGDIIVAKFVVGMASTGS